MMIKTKITTIKPMICLLSCLVLASCSVPMEVRNSAKVLSAYTVQIQKEAEDFSKFRLVLAKERYDNINQLEDNATKTERSTESELDFWNMKNIGKDEKDERVLLYEFIHDKTQDYYFRHIESISRMEEQNKAVSNMKSAVDIKSKDLHETAESLSELSKKPDLKTQLIFFAGFTKEVGELINEMREGAEDSSGKGKQKVNDKKGDGKGNKKNK